MTDRDVDVVLAGLDAEVEEVDRWRQFAIERSQSAQPRIAAAIAAFIDNDPETFWALIGPDEESQTTQLAWLALQRFLTRKAGWSMARFQEEVDELVEILPKRPDEPDEPTTPAERSTLGIRGPQWHRGPAEHRRPARRAPVPIA